MSQYLMTEDRELTQVGSNLGWSDFCDWIKTLDDDKYSQAIMFVEDGDDYSPETLANEIRMALEESPPADDVRSTAEGVIEFLDANRTAEMIMVTDGMSEDEDEDEDSEDEPTDDDE